MPEQTPRERRQRPLHRLRSIDTRALLLAVLLASSLAVGTVVVIAATPDAEWVPVGVAVSEGASMGNPSDTVLLYADVEPEVGDRIVFDAGSDGFVHHRIVDDTQAGWMTKGDARNYIDQQGGDAALPYATEGNTRGVVIASAPAPLVENAALGALAGLLLVLGLVLELAVGLQSIAMRIGRALQTGRPQRIAVLVLAFAIVLSTVTPFIGLLGVVDTDHAGTAAAASGDLVWENIFSGTREVWSSPTRVEGVTYWGHADGPVYALNDTGGVKWKTETHADVRASPQVVDGVVYVTNRNGRVIALDKDTGSEQWNVSIGSDTLATPRIAGNTLYVGTEGGTFYALDTADGSERWNYSTGNRMRAQPLVVDDRVYFGDSNGLHALYKSNGTLVWNGPKSLEVRGDPTFYKNRLIYGGEGNILVTALNGTLLWRDNPGGGYANGPTVHEDNIYVTSDDDGDITSYHLNGTQRWYNSDGSYSDTEWSNTPTVVGDRVYFQGKDGPIALDTNGTKLWTDTSTTHVTSSVIVQDGVIYFGGLDSGGDNPRIAAIEADKPTGSSEGSAAKQGVLGHLDGYDGTALSSDYTYGIGGGGGGAGNVNGTVVDQSGQPVENATVLATEFDQNALKVDGRLLDDIMQKPVPQAWTDQVDNLDSFSEDQFTPDFGTDEFSEKRVLMQTRSDWSTSPIPERYFISHFVLEGEPPENIPARPAVDGSESVIFSCWQPDDSLKQDPIDSSIPGAATTDCTIQVERIDPLGNTVWDSPRTVDTEPFIDVAHYSNIGEDGWTRGGPVKTHELTSLDLDAGVYKVYPKGHSEAALYYSVAPDADVDQLEPGVENWDSACSASSSVPWHNDVCDKQDSLSTIRTTTNASGWYELNIDETRVDTAHLAAVKKGDVSSGDLKVTKDDVRASFESTVKSNFDERAPSGWQPDEYTREEFQEYCQEMPSVADDVGMPYIGKASTTVPGQTDIKGVRAPPPELPSAVQECAAMNIVDDLLNDDLGFSAGGFLDDFSSIGDDAQAKLEALLEFVSVNDALRSEVEEQTGVSIDSTDPSDYTDEETRTLLQDGSTVLDNPPRDADSGSGGGGGGGGMNVGGGGGGPSVGDGEEAIDDAAETVSMVWDVSGVDNWGEASVLVRLDWSNGTTTTLTPDSEFVSIDERVARSDQVTLTDYPVGDADPAVVNPRLDLATPEGVDGTESPGVRNPTFDGEIPALEHIRLSSIQPGASETVDVEIAGDSGLGDLKRVTVQKPDGTSETTQATNGTANWTAGGAGVHRVEVVMTNPGGTEFTEVVRVNAQNQGVERPPTVRSAVGSVGRYAVASDGMEAASVDVSNGASNIHVVGVVPEDVGSVVVDTTDSDISPDATHEFEFREGPDERALTRSIEVIARQPETSEDAIFYREGDPMPRDHEGPSGSVDQQGNATVWRTFTTGDGTLETRTINDPSWFQATWYDLRLSLPIDPGSIGDDASPGAVALEAGA